MRVRSQAPDEDVCLRQPAGISWTHPVISRSASNSDTMLSMKPRKRHSWRWAAVAVLIALLVLGLGFRTPHMKRPCQALAGPRVIDHLMSVSMGCFCAWSACPPGGVAVPAGWVRAAAAGRAGPAGAGLYLPAFPARGPQRLRRPGRPAGPSPQAMRSSLDAGGAAPYASGPASGPPRDGGGRGGWGRCAGAGWWRRAPLPASYTRVGIAGLCSAGRGPALTSGVG